MVNFVIKHFCYNSLQSWVFRGTQPNPEKILKTYVYVFIIVMGSIISLSLNYHSKVKQYEFWEQNHGYFFLNEKPLYSTTDAPYFIAQAQELKRNDEKFYFHQRRNYPNRDNFTSKIEDYQIKIPMLSRIIASLSPSEKIEDLLKTGNNIIPFSALITATAIIFVFGITGFWFEGIVASIGSGFSLALMHRASIGRIDTDQLNIAFFYFLIGLIILVSQKNKKELRLIFTVILAIFSVLFQLWYPQPVFGWFFLSSYFFVMFFSIKDLKITFYYTGLFAVLTGWLFAGSALGNFDYFVTSIKTDNFDFPNTLSTVTELKKPSLDFVFNNLAGSNVIGFIGLFGFVLWCLVFPSFGVVFAPILFFLFLSFYVGSRTIFYLAPVIWFGFAYLVFFIIRKFLEKNRIALRLNYKFKSALLILTLISLMVVAYNNKGKGYIPNRSFSPEIIAAFEKINEYSTSRSDVVATWWDYGYSSMMLNNLATLHDGGKQNTPSTYFVAHALMSSNQNLSANILKFIANERYANWRSELKTKRDLHDRIKSYDGQKLDFNIFLVLTAQMANWAPSISKIGLWNIDGADKYPKLNEFDAGSFNYGYLKCNNKIVSANNIRCGQKIVDLKRGAVDGQDYFGALIISDDGKIVFAKKYALFEKDQPILQILKSKNRVNSFQLVPKKLYTSTFNQMFFLGNLEEQNFELIYDNYPHYKIIKLKN